MSFSAHRSTENPSATSQSRSLADLPSRPTSPPITGTETGGQEDNVLGRRRRACSESADYTDQHFVNGTLRISSVSDTTSTSSVASAEEMICLPSPPEQHHRRELRRSDTTDPTPSSSNGRPNLSTSASRNHGLAERERPMIPTSSHGNSFSSECHVTSTESEGPTHMPANAIGHAERDTPARMPSRDMDTRYSAHPNNSAGIDRHITRPSQSNRRADEAGLSDRASQRPSRHNSITERGRTPRRPTKVKRRPTERSISPNERFLLSLSSQGQPPHYRNLPHATWDRSAPSRTSTNVNSNLAANLPHNQPIVFKRPPTPIPSAEDIQSAISQTNRTSKSIARRHGVVTGIDHQTSSQSGIAAAGTTRGTAAAGTTRGTAAAGTTRGADAARSNISSWSWTSSTNVLSQTSGTASHDDRCFFGFSVPTQDEYEDVLNETSLDRESDIAKRSKRSTAYQLATNPPNHPSEQQNSSVNSSLHRNPTYTAQYEVNGSGRLQWMYAGAYTSSDVTTSTSSSSSSGLAASGYQIFERDVEANQQQDPEEVEFTLRHTRDVPQDGVFPPDVLTALEHDGDAIMQAAIQWDNGGYLQPGYCSSSDSNQSICRICHCGESYERLLNPCKCAGSIKWIHQACLIKWLAECGVVTCELCGYKYKFRRTGSKNCFRWKSIALDISDRLHIFLLVFAGAFLIVTLSFVVWVTLSHNKKAVEERRDTQSEIVFPIYSCLDALALGIVCFELKHNCRRIYQRWRAKNMGLVVLTRKTAERQESSGSDHTVTGEVAVTNDLDQQQSPPQESGSSLDDGCEPAAIRSYVASRQESNVDYQTL